MFIFVTEHIVHEIHYVICWGRLCFRYIVLFFYRFSWTAFSLYCFLWISCSNEHMTLVFTSLTLWSIEIFLTRNLSYTIAYEKRSTSVSSSPLIDKIVLGCWKINLKYYNLFESCVVLRARISIFVCVVHSNCMMNEIKVVLHKWKKSVFLISCIL